MDNKAILAIALSLAIWVGWQKIYWEPLQQQAAVETQRQQEIAKRAETRAEVDSRGILPEIERKKIEQKMTAAAVSTVVLESANSHLKASNEPWAIQDWELKSFSRTLEKQDEKVTLGQATGFSSQMRVRFSDPALSQQVGRVWDAVEKQGNSSVVTRLRSADMEATRFFTLDETGYGARLEYKFRFTKEPPKFVFLDVLGSPKRESDTEGSIFGQAPDKVHVTFRDLNGRHSHMGANLTENVESVAGVKWLGLDTRYFVLAMVPSVSGGEPADFGAQVAHEQAEVPAVRGSLVFATQGKKEFTAVAKVYFGPKHLESLKQVDPVLTDAVDFGWTSFIAVPLLQALKWLFSYVKNYGVAIIVLTFLIKMVLFPLTYKSMKSMSKMTKLQPQLNALREKFKDDKEKLNVEMMTFMRSNGYNPLGGCLPILVQMPIFFALYRVLFNSMELYQAPFVGWIHDLSSPDPFFVTPILLTGLMYLQQKISPNTVADPAQQKMLQIMPVMFGAFMLMLPAGLTIYMVVNSAVSIVQQWILNHKLGLHPAQALPLKA